MRQKLRSAFLAGTSVNLNLVTYSETRRSVLHRIIFGEGPHVFFEKFWSPLSYANHMQFERQKSQFYPYRYGFTGKYFDICIFSSDTVLLSFSILFFIYFILVVARPRCSHPRTSNIMEVILLFAVIISISRASEHENSQENEEYLMVDSGRRSSKDMKISFTHGSVTKILVWNISIPYQDYYFFVGLVLE